MFRLLNGSELFPRLEHLPCYLLPSSNIPSRRGSAVTALPGAENQPPPPCPGAFGRELCTGCAAVVFHRCVSLCISDNLDFLDSYHGFTHGKEETASCGWFCSGTRETFVQLWARFKVEDSSRMPRALLSPPPPSASRAEQSRVSWPRAG